MAQTLKYESEPRLYGFQKSTFLSDEKVDDLIISEHFDDGPHEDLEPGLGYYNLSVESVVSTDHEFWKTRGKIFDLIRELNKIWVYVTGYPLSRKVYSSLVIRVTDPGSAPPEWKTNASTVKNDLTKEQGFLIGGEVNIITRSYIWLPAPPLLATLQALERYQNSPEEIRTLVDLHDLFHMDSLAIPVRLIVMAKALELAAALLPGKTRKQKESALPPEVKQELNDSLAWLFEIANTRREIRHPVTKNLKDSVLHPTLEVEERKRFCHQSDLVVKSVVCKALGVEVPIVKEGSPSRDS